MEEESFVAEDAEEDAGQSFVAYVVENYNNNVL